jgi:ATP-dependent DNA helicase RecG
MREDFRVVERYLEGLPFEPTRAQKRVIGEILHDLVRPEGLNRLLQGDVGAGKTVVAGAAMAAVIAQGYQAALMAPTEVLAHQHARTLGRLFAPLGIAVALLTGALPESEKRRIRRGLAAGTIQAVVGTHALIQESVRFAGLGLVVVDEQQRFGVRQRAALLGGERMPHVLVMTATPIPRTLALTAYADLDLSILDELPPGRRPVRTHLVPPHKREDLFEFVRKRLLEDERAYFLYPAIEETEKQDLAAAKSAFEELSQGIFADLGVGLLHGRMRSEEKQRTIEDFAAGRIRVLVSTTVVEVGVDVPEATIMVVEHPDRFGLSQLHQLRGRVGRGKKGGYCFLLLPEGIHPSAEQRLRLLVRETDGFRIAEEDLKMRGPGEFFGVRQHGAPGFRLANPLTDRQLVEEAREEVERLLQTDPDLRDPDHTRCLAALREWGGVDPRLGEVG